MADNTMNEKLARYGFVFLNEFGTCSNILEIGKRLGGIYKVPTMPLVQSLTPRCKETEKSNTYSGLFGYGDFPFHTDMAHWHVPPRYIVMRCEIPNEDVSTRIVSANTVLPDHRSSIARRALFKPRRRLDNKSYFVRLSEHQFWRWDSVFIQPANELARQLKTDIEVRLSTVPSEEIRFTRPGQVLILDNWSVLHGRSAVANNSHRSVERIYLESVHL